MASGDALSAPLTAATSIPLSSSIRTPWAAPSASGALNTTASTVLRKAGESIRPIVSSWQSPSATSITAVSTDRDRCPTRSSKARAISDTGTL